MSRAPDLEQAMRRVKDRGLLFERSLARVLAAEVERLEAALDKATMGKCTCSGCGREVNNAWRSSEGYHCLTCLAKRAEAAEVRVIHLEQTVGNHECALRAMDAVKAKMEARVKELEEHLKGTMRAGGFDYFSELVVLANRRTHNATYVAEQAQKKVSELEAALEMGQRNCDDVYNDLRAEREAAKRLASQLAAQLAECAGMTPGKGNQ